MSPSGRLPTRLKRQMPVTDEIILEHKFTIEESWMVFFSTFITACSYLAVMVALAKTHQDRGKDIVLTGVAAPCFLIYRALLAFRIEDEDAEQ